MKSIRQIERTIKRHSILRNKLDKIFKYLTFAWFPPFLFAFMSPWQIPRYIAIGILIAILIAGIIVYIMTRIIDLKIDKLYVEADKAYY